MSTAYPPVFTYITAPFNNMRKFKAQLTNAFFATLKCSAAPPSSQPMFRLNCAQQYDYRMLGSSRKLGEAAEHLIDSSEKRICWLRFEFQSLHVIERCSKVTTNVYVLFKVTVYLQGCFTCKQYIASSLSCRHLHVNPYIKLP